MNLKVKFYAGIFVGILYSFFWSFILESYIKKGVSTIATFENKRSDVYNEAVTHIESKIVTSLRSGPQYDHNFTFLMEAIQAERLFIMNKICKNKTDHSIWSSRPSEFVQLRNFYSKTYGVSVCHIQNCGYNEWLRAFLVMESFYSVKSFLAGEIKGIKVMDFAKENITVKSIKNSYLRRKALSNSFQIILVQNPFSRLVSAYFNKLVPSTRQFTDFYGQMARRIIAKYKPLRHNIYDRSKPDDGIPSFEDFVNFLLYDQNLKDENWRMVHKICEPCSVNYNYIAKFETLSDDLEYIKKKLKISDYHSQAFFPNSVSESDYDITKKTFQSIPKFLARNLFEKYKTDFDLFGYEQPSWL